VQEYSSLLRDLWFGHQMNITPQSFRRSVGKINPDYAGFVQHDVHEALEFLIDKIHEDLNKVVSKPYTEVPEGDGTNDREISQLAWVSTYFYFSLLIIKNFFITQFILISVIILLF
jgi:ubiquitin C-terminal hydrolase